MAHQASLQSQPPWLPNAACFAPLPDDFDFDARCEPPPSVKDLLLPVVVRNRLNVIAEKHNLASVAQTRICQYDRPSNASLDVGPPLMATYDYGDEEIQRFVKASEEYILKVGPIPTFVRSIIKKERLRRHNEEEAAEELRKREKEGQTVPREHYWEPDPTIVRDKFGHGKMPIPPDYLQSVCAGIIPDLHFWTEGKLDLFLSDRRRLITKELTLGDESDDEEVTVVDLVEMHKLWGTDEDWTCITAMGYVQALENLLTAVKKLLDAPAHAAAHELESHVEYICSLPHFEESYPYWYSWERETRNRILSLGMSFDLQEWKIALSVPLGKYWHDKSNDCLVSTLPKRPVSPHSSVDSRPFKRRRPSSYSHPSKSSSTTRIPRR